MHTHACSVHVLHVRVCTHTRTPCTCTRAHLQGAEAAAWGRKSGPAGVLRSLSSQGWFQGSGSAGPHLPFLRSGSAARLPEQDGARHWLQGPCMC